jgi:predicted nucleic acid-binding protein
MLQSLRIKFKSLELEYTDFEDALQTQCAKKIKAEYIITRNKKDFMDRSIKVVTPEEFLNDDNENQFSKVHD